MELLETLAAIKCIRTTTTTTTTTTNKQDKLTDHGHVSPHSSNKVAMLLAHYPRANRWTVGISSWKIEHHAYRRRTFDMHFVNYFAHHSPDLSLYPPNPFQVLWCCTTLLVVAPVLCPVLRRAHRLVVLLGQWWWRRWKRDDWCQSKLIYGFRRPFVCVVLLEVARNSYVC